MASPGPSRGRGSEEAQSSGSRAPYFSSLSKAVTLDGPGGAAPASERASPAARPTVYHSQPRLRVALGGEKREREQPLLPAEPTRGTPPGGTPPPLPHNGDASSPGKEGGSKRQRLQISRVTPESGRNDSTSTHASSNPRQEVPPCHQSSPPAARGSYGAEPRRAEYAGGGSHAGSPTVGASYLAGGFPHSPASGGQWAWRPDAPNPTGSYGAWVWLAGGPTMPPPLGPTGYCSAPPGTWGPATPSLPSGAHPDMPPPGYSVPPGYHASPGTPHMPPFGGGCADHNDGRYAGPASLPSQRYHHHSALPLAYMPHGAGMPPPYYGQPTPLPYQHQYMQPLALHPPGPREPRPPRTTPYLGVPKDPAVAAAIACNKRITAATRAQEIFDIVDQEHAVFDTVCLATAMHKLANLRGAPNLHAQIVHAPEFFKLKQLIYKRHSEFTARNLANTLWSLAKVNHHPGDEFLAGMAAEVKGKAREGNAQNVANMLWAFATLGYPPGDEAMQALAEAAKEKLGEFTSQNMSNAVLAFAKLEFDPGDELLEGLAGEALRKISTFSPQALSNTLWGLSKLGIQADELMEGIGQAARSQLYEYNSQNLANSVWAYANINVNPGADLMQEFARVAIMKMPEFSPQNISNLCWAYAKLGIQHHELFAEAGKHAARIMHTFTPQSISNLLWSFATLDVCPDMTFLHSLVGKAVGLLAEFSPQNLSNTAWALATLKDREPVRLLHRGLVASIAAEVTRRLLDRDAADDFSRQHLANFVWAAATLEYDPGKRSLMCIAEALVSRADLCNPQEVSNSVWAFAKLAHYDGALMHTMAAEATRRIDEFSQQNLSNLAWAYSKLAHLDEQLMTAIADRAESMVHELSLQHCTNLVWAYSSLKWFTPTLMPALVAEVKARMDDTQFNVQQVCNLLWSLAIAEQCDRQIWDQCVEQLGSLDIPFHELPSEALTQVFQAYMLMLAQAPDTEWPIPEALLVLAQHAWVQSTKKIKISEFHAEVSRMLSMLGQQHTIEHLTEDHLFSVDIALPEERIAVEVDGPHHYTANTFQPLGEMYCRHTLLRARGWRVVSVPFYHWSGVTEEDRQVLLQRVLREAHAQPVPMVHPVQAAVSARLDVLRQRSEADAALHYGGYAQPYGIKTEQQGHHFQQQQQPQQQQPQQAQQPQQQQAQQRQAQQQEQQMTPSSGEAANPAASPTAAVKTEPTDAPASPAAAEEQPELKEEGQQTLSPPDSQPPTLPPPQDMLPLPEQQQWQQHLERSGSAQQPPEHQGQSLTLTAPLSGLLSPAGPVATPLVPHEPLLPPIQQQEQPQEQQMAAEKVEQGLLPALQLLQSLSAGLPGATQQVPLSLPLPVPAPNLMLQPPPAAGTP